MYLKLYFTLLAFSLLFWNCSSNSAPNSKTTASPEVVQEIQTLDSLNESIEKNTMKIEESIQSVEEAVNELSNF